MINIVEDGNILGIPCITHADIKCAYELFGEPVACICEEMTKKKILHAQFSEELKSIDKDQVMNTDIMKIDGKKSLISVCSPLQLTRCMPVKDESVHVIDVGGVQDFVAKVGAKIRRVKETYWSVKAGLAWKLPP